MAFVAGANGKICRMRTSLLIINGYAKEVMNNLPMEFAVEAQKLLSISLEAVSYTHLDVYKRQILFGLPLMARCEWWTSTAVVMGTMWLCAIPMDWSCLLYTSRCV